MSHPVSTVPRLFQAAQGILDTVLNTGTNVPNGDSRSQQINRLAHYVKNKMVEVERATGVVEPSVCALYLHFFLSIFALIESIVRVLIHALILLVAMLGYYIILCLTCGKFEGGVFIQHHLRMYFMYWSLFFAIIGNIIVPWHPPAYAFHSLTHKFTRPEAVDNHVLDALNTASCCCNCNCCLQSFGLPTHLILQSSLLSYGLARALSPSLCCGEALPTMCSYDGYCSYMLHLDAQDKAVATIDFYRANFHCDTFAELVLRELGPGGFPPPPAMIQQQQPHVPMTTGRVVQPQPIPARATAPQQAYIPVARVATDAV